MIDYADLWCREQTAYQRLYVGKPRVGVNRMIQTVLTAGRTRLHGHRRRGRERRQGRQDASRFASPSQSQSMSFSALETISYGNGADLDVEEDDRTEVKHQVWRSKRDNVAIQTYEMNVHR
jgi:hypothetical protein